MNNIFRTNLKFDFLLIFQFETERNYFRFRGTRKKVPHSTQTSEELTTLPDTILHEHIL